MKKLLHNKRFLFFLPLLLLILFWLLQSVIYNLGQSLIKLLFCNNTGGMFEYKLTCQIFHPVSSSILSFILESLVLLSIMELGIIGISLQYASEFGIFGFVIILFLLFCIYYLIISILYELINKKKK